MLNNRISIFTSLPMNTLDSLALQKRLDEIGGKTADTAGSCLMIDLRPPPCRRSARHRHCCSRPSSARASWRERLTGGNVALALLGNTLPTGAILVVLITMLGPISGAHFNPAVTLVFALRREHRGADAALPMSSRRSSAASPASLLAHAMFELPLCEMSRRRCAPAPANGSPKPSPPSAWSSRSLRGLRARPDAIPWLVGLYITAAYWFTASTSFANPGRRHRAGVLRHLRRNPADRPARLHRCRTLSGAFAAMAVAGWMLRDAKPVRETSKIDEGSTNDRHDLSQPRLRHLAQHARHDPAVRRGTGGHRISEDAAIARNAGRADRRDGHPTARVAARRRARLTTRSGSTTPNGPTMRLIDFMLAQPILINRPIVVDTARRHSGAAFEAVLDMLPNPDIGPFTKEDGEVVIDATGKRVT